MRRWCFYLVLGILLAVATIGCNQSKATPTETSDAIASRIMAETRAEEAREQQRLEQQAYQGYQDWLSQQGTADTSVIVCNTDREGAMLRSDAACQYKTAIGLPDGTALEVRGELTSGCSSVRTADGSTGYVPSRYLCPAAPPCLIKGNVNFDTGEKIYHVPGQKYYDATVINPGYGERWFCTEAEAQANGWRRSKE